MLVKVLVSSPKPYFLRMHTCTECHDLRTMQQELTSESSVIHRNTARRHVEIIEAKETAHKTTSYMYKTGACPKPATENIKRKITWAALAWSRGQPSLVPPPAAPIIAVSHRRGQDFCCGGALYCCLK